MKKVLLILPALALAACAPTQGQKPMRYQAKSADILAAVSQIAPNYRPSNAHNYYSVIETTPTQVKIKADATTGFQILGANVPVTVTFTALESGNITTVSHSYSTEAKTTPGSPVDNATQNIYAELAKRFPVVP